MTPKFKITISKGKLKALEMLNVTDYCKSLPDGEYFLTIKTAKEKEIRSNNQNRYYWGCILKIISNETGYSVEECHELMKWKFNYKMLPLRDETVRIGLSTTELKTDKMEEYLSEVRQWASQELSCYIPLPNEVDYE